jgi:hypothetical protein
MIRHLIGQNDRRKKSLGRRRCRRGHRYDNPIRRVCNACARLRYHAKKRLLLEQHKRRQWRRRLIVAHPDHGGSPAVFRRVLNAYRRECAA